MTSIPIPYESINNFNVIQAFYADPEIVGKSGTVSITSVDLYFKSKPSQTNNVSGKPNPGVTVRLCELTNNEPDLTKIFYGATASKSYEQIYSFADASTATTFGFDCPVVLKTRNSYGIVVIFEDPAYELWTNKAGDKLVGTNNASAGSNLVRDGKLFLKNNSGVYKSLSDTDLKFGINVAFYNSNTSNNTFISRNYEFLTLVKDSVNGRFIGGEYVYQLTANVTGNVAFIANTSYVEGTGTNFTSSVANGDLIVLWANTSKRQIVAVDNVTNDTHLSTSTLIAYSNSQTKFFNPPSGIVHDFKRGRSRIQLRDSNAVTGRLFAANSNLIIGDASEANAQIQSVDGFSVDRVRVRTDKFEPIGGSVDFDINFASLEGGSYVFNAANRERVTLNNNRMFNIRKYDAHVVSRSAEVLNANLFSIANTTSRNSIAANVNIRSDGANPYESPVVNQPAVDVFTIQNIISNTYTTTDANSVVIDTETTNQGTALSKHITTKVSFANNRFAEDVRVYMTAYRPAGSDIKVYTRIHNTADPEAFDDKAWSPLEYKQNAFNFSSTEDDTDFIEYELGLPQYSETANVLPGNFTTELGNTIIVAAGVTANSYVAANDVIKIYNPTFPENYIVAPVTASNTTTITIGKAIANSGIVGSGFKVDRLKYYNTAFNNITNDNVARYYSSSLVEYDNFDSMQIKIVFLSDKTYIVPRVDQIQVLGVSA